jgi:hypothetical protein
MGFVVHQKLEPSLILTKSTKYRGNRESAEAGGEEK